MKVTFGTITAKSREAFIRRKERHESHETPFLLITRSVTMDPEP